jgi:hypothetical protein
LVAIGPALFSLHALAQSTNATAGTPGTRAAPPVAVPATSGGAEPIRVEYWAAAGCSNASGFLANVLARTPKARAATAHEMARVFRVSVTEQRGESAGEISVQRPGEATLVRFSASGTCEDVLNTLAQFAALVVDPSVASTPIQDGDLPPNPYRNWNGPLAAPLPENPYRNWAGDLAPSLPENPYRRALSAASATPSENPYRSRLLPADELPDNPYRQRLRTVGR